MKTETSPWQIDDGRARLQAELLQAEVDLHSPRAGLANVVYQGVSLNHLRCLQVACEPRNAAENRLVDRYARGSDLVATYAPTPPRTAGSGIYWRAVIGPERAAGIELIVSMQTGQLDSDSRVFHRSQLRASEVWWFAARQQPRFQQLQLPPSETWTTPGEDAAGAFLFRLTGHDVSYLELVAPADFETADVDRPAETPESIQLSYRLFPDRIEKGVIWRARVQGLVLPREHDLDVARECYRLLAAAPPPLTT